MVYIKRMRAQSRETDDIRGLSAAADLLVGERAQDLNLRPDVRVAVVKHFSTESKWGGLVRGPTRSGGYVDAVFLYPEVTKLEVAYGYLKDMWEDTAPKGDGYPLDFCPSRPKIVQLDDDDFPKPLTIERLPVSDRPYAAPVKKGEPLDRKLGYKASISFVNYFPQDEWKIVNAALRERGNQRKQDIPPSFWWFKEAADKAIVQITTRIQDVCGYPVPFVDVRLESQSARESKGLLGEVRDSFSGFKRWYFERMSSGRLKEYMRNSAIGYLTDPKNPNGLALRDELERLRRTEQGLEDLSPVENFIREGKDLEVIGTTMEASKPGRQLHRLAPFVVIKEGRIIEEEYPQRSASDKDKEIRVLRYYEVRGYDGSFISDEDLEAAFTPEGV